MLPRCKPRTDRWENHLALDGRVFLQDSCVRSGDHPAPEQQNAERVVEPDGSSVTEESPRACGIERHRRRDLRRATDVLGDRSEPKPQSRTPAGFRPAGYISFRFLRVSSISLMR